VARIVISNTSTSSWSVSFDYFILSSYPQGPLVAGRAISYKDFSQGVWDWQQANQGVSSSVTVPAGNSGQLRLDWPLVDQNAVQVAPGTYRAFVAQSVNGNPEGFSSASILVP
jgi:hypothetical protein